MTSDAATVDEYLKTVPDDRLAAMERIRSLVKQTHPGYVESMEFGMPCYSHENKVHVAFNSQRQAISLYILKEGVVNTYRHLFPKSAIGKGCIRYRNPAKIDFEQMEAMLRDAFASDEEPC